MHLLDTVLSFLSFFDKNYYRLSLHKLTKILQFLLDISKNITDFEYVDSKIIDNKHDRRQSYFIEYSESFRKQPNMT